MFSEPPSAPQNLTLNFVDQSTVLLSWSPPAEQGGREDTVYRVLCDGCGVTVSYIPNTDFFNDTKMTLTGLNPVTTYRFQVFAENGVSDVVGESSKYAEITVSTEASVTSVVTNVKGELSEKWKNIYLSKALRSICAPPQSQNLLEAIVK